MKKLTATVLIMDGEPDKDGEYCYPPDIQLPEEQFVSVRQDFDITKPIGKATLRKEGHYLIADIEILDKVKGDFFPSVAGNYTFKEGTARGTKFGCKITHLGFVTNENSDIRIKKLTV